MVGKSEKDIWVIKFWGEEGVSQRGKRIKGRTRRTKSVDPRQKIGALD